MHNQADVKARTGSVFLDLASLDRDDLDLSALERVCEPLQRFPRTGIDELADRAREAWCVIVNKVVLDRTFFEARPALRLVCVVATGTNNVDLEAAADHGVTVVNCQGYGTDSLAQHVLMLILALARSFPRYQADVAEGAWSRSSQFCLLDHPIREVGGRRLGIVGYGAIGRAVNRLAEAIGMEVVIADRPGASPRAGRMAFDEVVATSDVISLHCPLNAQTRGLFDAHVLQRMQSDALLINTARGGLVDEAALVRALREGWIGGAAVDVVSSEPPAPDNPLLAAGLDNLIVTPHCAWGSREARQRIVDQTTENIEAWLDGRPLRRVVEGCAN
ncbi:2-hydroxyacid dehydrogenase [Arhodomonas sp. AD133]|uniref:2-hydroxyacid dehydrogenase n=1 Tax=Arhodomonas sp. AD133 TaxID=3415009 RepID=UPI003EBA920C